MTVIRRGEAGDFAEIAAIQSAAPEAAQWDACGDTPYDLRVAECEGCMAGFLVARALGAGECELLNVAVSPGFRRQGVGGALVRSLTSDYPGAVFLEVRESNQNARKFYNSLGFKDVSTRLGYYESPSESAIVMKFQSC